MKYPDMVEAPEKVDSEDLTDEEIASSTDTKDEDDWVQNVVSWAAEGYAVTDQQQRRRGDDLFIRTTLQGKDDKKVLVCRANWLQGSTT